MDKQLALNSFILHTELRLFWVVFGVYLLALLLHVLNTLIHIPFCTEKLLNKRRFWLGKGANILLGLGAVAQVVMLGIHSYLVKRPPFLGKYESLSLLVVLTIVIYLIVRRRWGNIYCAGLSVSVFVCAMMYVSMATGAYLPRVGPVDAAHNSPWYLWHMGTSYVAYAGLTVAFVIEISFCVAWVLYLLHLFRPATRRVLGHMSFHRDAYRLVMFSFPLLTFALLSGAVWRSGMRGDYWGSNASEISALMMWVVFALYLHAMRMRRWRTVMASFFNILGFACLLLTLIGVTLLPFMS